jgi:predicted  nucleic acid-binding Zn-ribbon protein
MNRNIRLLESRVSRAAERLRQLSDERDRLSDKVRNLEQRIEERQVEAAVDARPPDAERQEIVDGLRRALRELRGGT